MLSVLNGTDIFHYQIRRHGEDAFFYIDEQQPIHGLDSLIDQYRGAPYGPYGCACSSAAVYRRTTRAATAAPICCTGRRARST